MFSKKITEILKPFIKNHVEFLPVLHESLELYIVNVLAVTDVVDLERSVCNRTISGIITDVEEVYFLAHKLNNLPIFKVLERNVTDVYVNEDFVRLITDAKIKGFDFQEVWNSEFTEVMETDMKEKYQRLLAQIENYRGPTYKWDDAVRLVHSGKAMRSGTWKIQEDYKGELQILILKGDCQYYVLETVYIPPAMLFAEWHETEKSEV